MGTADFVRCNIHLKYKGSINAAHTACHRNCPEALISCIRCGIDINVPVDDGDTCAIICAQYGHIKCLQILKESKLINLNVRGNFGHTAFYRAALHDHPSTVKYLMINGANPNIPDDQNIPVVVACFQARKFASLEILAELNISFEESIDFIDNENNEHMNALHWACINNKPLFLKYLLISHANVNKWNKFGETGAHFAAISGSVQCLQLLAKYGGDMKFQDLTGQSPLDRAKKLQQVDSIQFLENMDDHS